MKKKIIWNVKRSRSVHENVLILLLIVTCGGGPSTAIEIISSPLNMISPKTRRTSLSSSGCP